MPQPDVWKGFQSRPGAYFALAAALSCTMGARLLVNDAENLGDIHMYISIAQAMDSGGILYKDVVDIKNMGFLFFFYGLYKPYALAFPLMTYFTAYINALLILFYYTITMMMYELLRHLFRPLTALWGAGVFLLYFPLVGNHLNFNQPQYALFTWLLLGLFLAYPKSRPLWHYFIIGGLLGLNTAGNAPYVLLTLIVPFVIERKGRSAPQYFAELFIKGGAAFAGFLLALAPYFWYFYKYQALVHWWDMQVVFSQLYSSPSWDMIWGYIPIRGSNGGSLASRIFAAIPPAAALAYLMILAKKIPFSPVFVLALLSAASRIIFLSRNWSWYTLYFLPLITLMLCIRAESKPQTERFTAFWGFWVLGALCFPVENSAGIASYRSGYVRWGYDKKAAYTALKNPEKHPGVYVSARPHGFAYSTKWNYIYYNLFSYPDGMGDENGRDNNQTIAFYKPEACIIGTDIEGADYLQGLSYPVLEEDYIKVSPTFYIRKDHADTWDLSIDEEEYSAFVPILSLADLSLRLLSPKYEAAEAPPALEDTETASQSLSP